MRELSVCLEHRRQHGVAHRSEVSPDRPQPPVDNGGRQPSYVNHVSQPLALDDDTSDDDGDGYMEPIRCTSSEHVDRVDEEDDSADDVVDSDCDTLSGRETCHDYINVLKCHN